jgi:hypothetical protein
MKTLPISDCPLPIGVSANEPSYGVSYLKGGMRFIRASFKSAIANRQLAMLRIGDWQSEFGRVTSWTH